MLKRIMVLMLSCIVSIAYIEAYADMQGAAQMTTIAKVGASQPNIKLAVNDVMQLQGTPDKRLADKKTKLNEPGNQIATNQLSEVPAQAWLILTALFCFVMRSSRRVV